MSGEPKCSECGCVVSYETGFTMTGTLAEGSKDSIYCPEHAPKQSSKGYTLAALQRMREDNQVERAKYQMAKMEQLGADVYFHVTGPTYPPEDGLA